MKFGKKTAGQVGDITSTDKSSDLFTDVFSVECKHYKDIVLWNLITGGKSGITKFWEQTIRQADVEGKQPFMVVKQNNKPIQPDGLYWF